MSYLSFSNHQVTVFSDLCARACIVILISYWYFSFLYMENNDMVLVFILSSITSNSHMRCTEGNY